MRRAGRSWPAWGACISYGIAASAAKRYLCGLPALVTASRVRRGSQLALRLEVLHVRTGETVALHDRLLADRLLQHSYNRSPRSLELRSAKATIRLDFDAAGSP